MHGNSLEGFKEGSDIICPQKGDSCYNAKMRLSVGSGRIWSRIREASEKVISLDDCGFRVWWLWQWWDAVEFRIYYKENHQYLPVDWMGNLKNQENLNIKDYRWKISKNSVWHLRSLLASYQIRRKSDADPERTQAKNSDSYQTAASSLEGAGREYCFWRSLTRNWTRLKVLNLYCQNAAVYHPWSYFSNFWTQNLNIIIYKNLESWLLSTEQHVDYKAKRLCFGSMVGFSR